MATIAETVRSASEQLRGLFPEWDPPSVLVQLGSGFKSEGLLDEESGAAPLARLEEQGQPPEPTGDGPLLRLGRCGERQVLVLEGHRYFYEGLGAAPCVVPILAAAAAGIPNIVLVEAGLTLREGVRAGSWMALTDYINNQGIIPLAGCAEVVKELFAEMGEAFSQVLNAELINAMANVGISPRLGVYQGDAGPQFETPAEVAAARHNGADIVGHGVIAETIAGTAAGCRVSALVLVAETAPTYRGKRVSRRDVMDAVEFCSRDMMRGLRRAFRDGDLFGAPAAPDPAEVPALDLRLGIFR